MQNIGWFGQSMIAAFALTFGWFCPRFFEKNLGVSPLATATLYFLGVTITCLLCTGLSSTPNFPRLSVSASIIGLGMVFGGVATVLLFQASTTASSPGLPVAVSNVACVSMLVVSVLAFRYSPHYFDEVRISFTKWSGVALIVLGTVLVGLKR